MLRGKHSRHIEPITCYLIEERIPLRIIYDDIDDDDNEESSYPRHTPENETITKKERFYICNKLGLEILETYLDYSVHIYSLKEIRDLRERKAQTSLYTAIHFEKKSVNLILIKKEKKNLKTPFIYLDYFILRLYDMLTVKNTIKIIENEHYYDKNGKYKEKLKRETIKREFKLTLKAFDYYRYSYNFNELKFVNHGIKTKRERKRERECEGFWVEELESIKQQELEAIKQQELAHERFFSNKEPKLSIDDRCENQWYCSNDLEKELDKLNYRIAYEYLKINTLRNVPYEAKYEKKDLDKIVMLIVKKAKKDEYIMEKVNQQKEFIPPSLEKPILYS